MRKPRFTEEQLIETLQDQAAGGKLTNCCACARSRSGRSTTGG